MQARNKTSRRDYGFTLIEVMITVAIIAVLAGIAFPSYQSYVQRANRAEARNSLLSIAQRLEQNYVVTGAYSSAATTTTTVAINNQTLVDWDYSLVPATGATTYSITFVTGEPTTTTFTLQATPVGNQASDACGILVLRSLNLKGANGQNNRSQVTRDCWAR